MMMPARPISSLIIRQAGFTLAALQAFFHAMFGLGHSGTCGQRCRIPHLCGIEAYENRFVVHRKWLPDKHVVVPEESAGRYFSAPVLLRNTDHFSAAKPDGINHPSHELLVDFFQKHFTLTLATPHFEQAVDGFRRAGHQVHLPHGLLARAELHRLSGDMARSQADLDDAQTIATRSGMALYHADCYLGYVWLHLVAGHTEKAHASLSAARELIQRLGYHRRNAEVVKLEGLLEAASTS